MPHQNPATISLLTLLLFIIYLTFFLSIEKTQLVRLVRDFIKCLPTAQSICYEFLTNYLYFLFYFHMFLTHSALILVQII